MKPALLVLLVITLALVGCQREQNVQRSETNSAQEATQQTTTQTTVDEVKTQPRSIPPLPGTGWSSETASPPPNPGPEVVNYEGSPGTVTFPHADHAGRLACSQCHPTEPPEAIAMNKTFAHSTCMGCHTNSGAGPTGCKQCHVK